MEEVKEKRLYYLTQCGGRKSEKYRCLYCMILASGISEVKNDQVSLGLELGLEEASSQDPLLVFQ